MADFAGSLTCSRTDVILAAALIMFLFDPQPTAGQATAKPVLKGKPYHGGGEAHYSPINASWIDAEQPAMQGAASDYGDD